MSISNSGDVIAEKAVEIAASVVNITNDIANITENISTLVEAPELPVGGATEAKQDTGNTSLASIDGKITAVNTGAVAVASSALPAGASTEATLALIKAKTDNIDVALSTRTKPADQQHVIVDSSATVAVTGPLTDTQLRASAVPVSGTVSVSQPVAVTDNSGSLTVDGTVDVSSVSGTVAVSGPLTDTQLRASAVPVSGTVSINQPVAITDNSGSITVDGTVAISGTVPVSGPLTDTQLRASAVPVSAASLPLPSGASTEATLALIKAKTDNIPAQGQALAAGSTPVVLTAAQVTTLTPPAAITNFATETGGNLATIAGKDFATQTTLALIKAKTDNIDVALSTRTKPADTQIIGDGGGSITVDGTVAISGTVPVSGTVAVSTVGGETLTKKTVTVAASGNTTLYTPASGKKVRLYFFGYSAGAGATGNLVGLKLTGYNSSAVFDNQYLVAPGQPYARNIQGGKRYIEGSADGALIVNCGSTDTVYVNLELEEVS